MKLNNFFSRKGQGLPLNTVVIAILVVLVLVILIVYFTTSMNKTGDDIEQNTQGVNACKVGSYIIPADKYSDVDDTKNADESCKDGWVRIYSAKTDEGKICCAELKINTQNSNP